MCREPLCAPRSGGRNLSWAMVNTGSSRGDMFTHLSNALFALSALYIPTLDSSWRICLCRFETSTVSWSMIPSLPVLHEHLELQKRCFFSPTPAAPRYCRAGHPSPPAPTTATAALESLTWPSRWVSIMYSEKPPRTLEPKSFEDHLSSISFVVLDGYRKGGHGCVETNGGD